MKLHRPWSVGQQILVMFGTLCVVLDAIGGLFFFSLRAIEKRQQTLHTRAQKREEIADEISKNIGLTQNTVYRHVLATDAEEKKQCDQFVHWLDEVNVKVLAEYETLAEKAEGVRLFARIAPTRQVYLERTEELLALSRTNRNADKMDRATAKQLPAYADYQAAADGLMKNSEYILRDVEVGTDQFITRIRFIGDTLVGLAILIAIGTGFAVVRITRRLKGDNQKLQIEIGDRTQAEEELRWKTAFLEALMESSVDGILVVNDRGVKIFQNRRAADLLNLPQHIIDDTDDGNQLRWVTSITRDPELFVEKVSHLNLHPDEVSSDEIVLKNGTILDRYSSPVVGKGQKYYGRIWTFRDITGRKRTETALLESNQKFHQLADNITDAFWIRSPDMREVHYISPAFERIWGRSVASLYANPQEWANFIFPEDRERVLAVFAGLTGNAPSLDIEYRILRPDGEIRWVRVRGFQVRDAANKLIRHTGIVTDITDRKRLEAQMFQSQKMETVGKLAGGIAHEFNSIMTAIIGQSELLLADLPAESPLARNVSEISQAALRAATLTRQLLAYGRKQILQPKVLDLNHVLASLEGVLRHLMGPDVNVRLLPGAGPKAVKVDAGQIEHVIVNIVMNAADAMPNGGQLTLETGIVTFDEEYVARFPELKAGEYVMLAITDTGAGMSDEVEARIFEPFFTTKGVGRGTGLGLAACYGILKQSAGHIAVYSEPGRGSTFKIYLPHVNLETSLPAQRPASADLPRGTETILVVEDDAALRAMTETLLKRLGYTVLTAADGVEALNLTHQSGIGYIDLLFTDVVMPHMSGKELTDRVRMLFPKTSILFTSAYTESAIVHQGVLNPGVALLQKPFTPSMLAVKVREILDKKKL